MNRTKIAIHSLILSLTIINCSNAAECVSSSNEIPLWQIEAMFEEMKTNPKLNVDSELLWGYFFFDSNKEKLEKLSSELFKNGYRQVELFFNAKDYTLHVERPEKHTPQSLFERDAEFIKLAHEFCIRNYDGFDVGLYR